MVAVREQLYFARHIARDVEHQRLHNVEAALDPLTRRRLDHVGLEKGWRCLEVGAGHGSIARWLAHEVGHRGRVVATDIDLRLLDHLEGSGVEVRQHDVCTDPLEECGAYDLVHCRLVLMHVSEPEVALERMVGALRPGGWLVVEEPVFTEPLFVTREHAAAGAVERVYAALTDYLSVFMDLHFGEKVLQMVADQRMDDFYAEQTRLYAHGGHPGPIVNMLTWEMFRDQLLASEAIAPDDIDLASAAMLDPSFIASSAFMFGVFGRKPLS